MSDYCVVTTDNELFNLIAKYLDPKNCEDTVFCIDNPYEAAQYMCFELPEMMIVNFSDKKIDSFVLLETAMNDPWLLNSGIIAIYETVVDEKRVEKIQKRSQYNCQHRQKANQTVFSDNHVDCS